MTLSQLPPSSAPSGRALDPEAVATIVRSAGPDQLRDLADMFGITARARLSSAWRAFRERVHDQAATHLDGLGEAACDIGAHRLMGTALAAAMQARDRADRELCAALLEVQRELSRAEGALRALAARTHAAGAA